jgi:hypothetical protein
MVAGIGACIAGIDTALKVGLVHFHTPGGEKVEQSLTTIAGCGTHLTPV